MMCWDLEFFFARHFLCLCRSFSAQGVACQAYSWTCEGKMYCVLMWWILVIILSRAWVCQRIRGCGSNASFDTIRFNSQSVNNQRTIHQFVRAWGKRKFTNCFIFLFLSAKYDDNNDLRSMLRSPVTPQPQRLCYIYYSLFRLKLNGISEEQLASAASWDFGNFSLCVRMDACTVCVRPSFRRNVINDRCPKQ